jgi:hypothetical protein
MTARTVLDPSAADRLVKLLGMLGSHHDGERANAARLADALVRERGLRWRDVITVSALSTSTVSWQRMAHWCHAHPEKLNSKEYQFILSMLEWHGEPSEKQQKWLTDLFIRAGGARS